MYGPEIPIHLHFLRLRMSLMAQVQEKEDQNGKPLTMMDLDELKFKRIFESGLHVGFIDSESEQRRHVAFVVKITYVTITLLMTCN